MFFKTRLAFALLVLMFASGCWIRLKEPISDVPLEIKVAKSDCLSSASNTLDQYLSGTSSDGEIGKFWSCVTEALKTFADKTQGHNVNFYTSNELRNFLQRYFLKNEEISDELLSEAMELKKAFVGGSARIVTRVELDRTIELIRVFSAVSVSLRPYFPLSAEHFRKMTPAQVDAGVQALERSATTLATELEKVDYPYTFTHMDDLARLIDRDRSGSLHLANIRDRIALMRSAKMTLFAVNPDYIAAGPRPGDSWSTVMLTAARWMAVGLRFAHLANYYETWSSGEGLTRFMDFWQEVDTLLHEAILRNPGRVIKFSTLDDLIDSFPVQDLQPVTADTLKKFMTPLVTRILAQGPNALGFDESTLERVRKSVDSWHEGQVFLNDLFAKANRVTGGQNQDGKGFTRETLLSLIPDRVTGAARRIRSILEVSSNLPMFVGNDKEASILDPNLEDSKRYSFHHLSEVNWMNEVSTTLIGAYTRDPIGGRANPTVTVSDFEKFYADLRDIGVELKFFDPNSQLPARKRFREANLFTYAGNGDLVVDVTEGTQLVAFLISGRRLAYRIQDTITDLCSIVDPVTGKRTGDISDEKNRYGYYQIKEDCFFKHFYDRFYHFVDPNTQVVRKDGFFQRLQYWGNYFDDLKDAISDSKRRGSQKELSDFKAAYELTARIDPTTHMIDSRDTEQFVMIAYYVEAIFRRFDVDRDQLLSRSEGERAFRETYKGTITELVEAELPGSTFEDPDLAMDVFLLYLKYGKKPDKFDIAAWRLKNSVFGRQDFTASRTLVLKIFGDLARKVTH